MCGIAGVFSDKPLSFHPLQKLVDERLSSRGPDYSGSVCLNSEGVMGSTDFLFETKGILWHKRLSIIDVSDGANQPMTNDYLQYIVFNGEIYNYIEIKKDLEKLGAKFVSSSDTEVILTAYAHWGIQAFNRFIGMFAFCIYDPLLKRIILVKDGLGIKPLYYAEKRGSLCFSSRVDLTSRLFGSNKLSYSSTLNFLESGISDDNNETFIEGIKSVMPGELRVYDSETLDFIFSSKITFESSSQVDPSGMSDIERVLALRELLTKSVHIHTRTDVGFCATLSGGLDSTSILGILASQGYKDINLFSYIPKEKEISEEKWIDIASNHFSVNVNKVSFDFSEFWSDLNDFGSQMDQPYNSLSMYSQYKIYQKVHDSGNKVVLDGQGGDEMFGGYIQYLYYAAYDNLNKFQFKKFLDIIKGSRETVSPYFILSNIARIGFLNTSRTLYNNLKYNRRDSLFDKNYFKYYGSASLRNYDADSLLSKLSMDLQFQDLPRLLRYADRNSMSWSLESRVPFASQPLMDFVSKLSSVDFVDKVGTTKALFRKSVEPFLPPEILSRKDKKGFNTNDAGILFTKQAIDHVASLSFDEIPFINKDRMISHLSGKSNYSAAKLWRLFSLVHWMNIKKISF